jgi:hypothetical protein
VIVLACDPGKSGGFAASSSCGDWTRTWKCPSTLDELHDLIAGPLSSLGVGRTIIEKVHSMPRDGVRAAFTFGGWYYAVQLGFRMLTPAAPDLVLPRTWQEHHGLVFPRSMGLTKTEKKNKHKVRAQELYPDIKITHANADALLILSYALR